MRASHHGHGRPLARLLASLALAGLCGTMAARAVAQDAPLPQEHGVNAAELPAPPPPPPPGPLKILSWNVATSPYAIAMRRIKSSTKTWRTSFGSERRTIDAPPPPQAAAFEADVVLLQGITNPRALRRLFPARRWRLVFSPRALESLPKGSVFTAPLSSVEVEAVAVRFRQGLRVVNRADVMTDPHPPRDGGAPSAATPAESPGLAVKVTDRGRTVWLVSVALETACAGPATPCARRAAFERWRDARRTAREATVMGGGLDAGAEGSPPCARQGIQVEGFSQTAQTSAKGEDRPVLGCVAELVLE